MSQVIVSIGSIRNVILHEGPGSETQHHDVSVGV